MSHHHVASVQYGVVYMADKSTARLVLDSVGGKGNVVACDVCMTRLRLTLASPDEADLAGLREIPSVLGVVRRGVQGLEVVFGPAVVDQVFEDLTALARDAATTVEVPERPQGTMNVMISPGRAKSYHAQALAHQARRSDASELGGILDQIKKAEGPTGGLRLLVINGPNLNMLGTREPGIYGRQDYAALVDLCRRAAAEAGFDNVKCFQSNHEGDIVDEIQRALHTADGIVINPGAYTHTSIAILDALKAVDLPAVEVHISKVDEREEFRQISYVRLACFETITGMGFEGYRKAIFDLAAHIAQARG